jgi:riboflavin biosynthesis pyrimidine reductase
VGTQTVIDDNPKLDERLTGGNPVESFWSKQSPTKKSCIWQSNQNCFFKTTDTDKENLTFTVIDFEKHSN